MTTKANADKVERTEVIAAEPTEALAALFDIDVPHGAGDPVPPLWHWAYLLERSPERSLGEDGHPVTGVPAPPEPGRRRMFGGGRVTTLDSLVIGEPATKTTSIKSSVEKAGKTGPFTVTTVLQEIHQRGKLVIREEQDIVYREDTGESLPAAAIPPAAAPGPTLSLAVDERLLFRFSALTYNAHRIHYDLEWCLREGYDGLVIHGPLLALTIGEYLRRQGIPLQGKTFGYRLVAPLTRAQTFTVVPGPKGHEFGAEARGADDTIAAVSTLVEA